MLLVRARSSAPTPVRLLPRPGPKSSRRVSGSKSRTVRVANALNRAAVINPTKNGSREGNRRPNTWSSDSKAQNARATSSGINDYASKSKASAATGSNARHRVKKRTGLDADPTFAHFTLAALHRDGNLVHWVQQNHDGLPQKAGFPQECINEIHGAWFDPSNPVVPMSGSLRGDLYQMMEDEEEAADFTLCIGTSLCGMNADRMVETPARRFVEQGRGLGACIIGFQQTPMDGRRGWLAGKGWVCFCVRCRRCGVVVPTATALV